MRAYIRFSESRLGPIGVAVVLLAGLLSVFFWAGYWVSQTNLANTPRPQGPQVIQIPLPNVEIAPESVPTPTQLLKMNPEDKIRL